ncbi:hypothetical protein Back11_35660 [Paenibacillus baekrokdamisoli]|uniref:Uncharacterized protein n=1 Tax=Paenibacillus baekrokdamisoli TaxID=1712516 RepID=A0A3G9J8S8_9BACL|nr:NHLP leader peptide family RiPP precursor [Paenibacillus baekrokdamisoli]MBB3070841.1 hypothetical protein [Paenibacillus baekrokdamisoli]BBH22221.1 hypothetical protein Back11_35660 [Paenibacillus baekrokdamisoli]
MSAEQELKEKIIEKAWSDPAFKQLLLSDPKAALQEAFGLTVPSDIQLTVLEETAASFYLVIPSAPTASASAAADDGGTVQGMW